MRLLLIKKIISKKKAETQERGEEIQCMGCILLINISPFLLFGIGMSKKSRKARELINGLDIQFVTILLIFGVFSCQ